MTDDAKPDYTTMSGAEFKRAVGADPEKWAEAFLQATCGWAPGSPATDRQREVTHALGFNTRDDRVALVAGWFRDAMEAAAKHVILQGTQMALDEMRRDDAQESQ